MTWTCPVCGFPELDEAPERFSICPCCGVEFENDDYWHSHAELRDEWVHDGMQWWSDYEAPPQDWNAKTQLAKLLAHSTAPLKPRKVTLKIISVVKGKAELIGDVEEWTAL